MTRRDYDYESQESKTNASSYGGATMPPSAIFERDPFKTVPIEDSRNNNGTEPIDPIGPTEPVYEDEKVVPVVGWLVGIKGCCRGQDFRLHREYNSVGRNSELDVVIKEPRISSAAALQILYDPATREFMALPGDSKSQRIAYHNGKPLLMPCSLAAYDRIQIGYDESKKDFIVELMFVPLCGEHFNWED